VVKGPRLGLGVSCGARVCSQTPFLVGVCFCAGLERAGFRVSRLEWAWNIFVTRVDWYKHGGEFPRGMSGSRISGFDWEKGLIMRVNALRGTSFEDAKSLADNLEIMPGARKLCYSLKKAGWKMIAISGGFTIITDKLKDELYLDKIYSNELIFKDGKLDGVKINVSSDKSLGVKSIIKEWGIKKEDIVVVVDGANDLKLFDIAGYTVGFCPVDIVKQRADATIEIRDLSILLRLLEKKFGKTIETQL